MPHQTRPSTFAGSNRRPRVVLVQLGLSPDGGANGAAAWILQALIELYEVELLTWQPPDLSGINRQTGTSLEASQMKITMVPKLLRKFVELDPDKGSVQRDSLLMRLAKGRRRHGDAIFTVGLESDLGGRGIQYLHCPRLDHVADKVEESCDLPWGRKLRAICAGRLRPWMLVSDYSFIRMRENTTLVNSDWTGRWVQRVYGIPTTTIYPPASGKFTDRPWQEREDAVLMIGRLHEGKRFDWVVEILKRIRDRGTPLRMHIVGSTGARGEEQAYRRAFDRLVAQHRDWVTLHEAISRDALAELASRVKYGVHAQFEEHFGMAPTEMVRAGMIVFVHNSGGQVEIVDQDPRLTYDSASEAEERMIAVINSETLQDELRRHLRQRASLFSPERFVTAIQREVESHLAETQGQQALPSTYH